MTESSKSSLLEAAEADRVAVRPDTSREATSHGASHAGPRVERAEARQQRDASCAPVTLIVTASDITDAKSFVDFLHRAGFSRAFAKRVTNRDAFKVAAESLPSSPEESELVSLVDQIKETAAAIGTASNRI